MAQHVLNFVRTTLRAPLGVSDTQLQLASGTGSLFNPIVSGDWTYITVNDATTAEVVKYTSSGNVINDTITVERAQDGTTAKAFPAGACVGVDWNVAQVEQLIENFSSQPFDTTLTNTTPNAPPPTGVIYAVNNATGDHWYWTGSVWVYLNSNSTQLLTTTPTSPPANNVRWAINTTSNSLYYWTGLVWLLVSSGGANYKEIFGRRYLTLGAGIALAVGNDYTFSGLVTGGMGVIPSVTFQSSPGPSVIQVSSSNTLVFAAPCIVELTATIHGDMDNFTSDFSAAFSIFHSSDAYEWQTRECIPANNGWTGVGMDITTGPVAVPISDEFDVEVSIHNGGGSYVGFSVTQFEFTASVIALL